MASIVLQRLSPFEMLENTLLVRLNPLRYGTVVWNIMSRMPVWLIQLLDVIKYNYKDCLKVWLNANVSPLFYPPFAYDFETLHP